MSGEERKNFSVTALSLINGEARAVATELGRREVTVLHLFIAVIRKQQLTRDAIAKIGANPDEVVEHLKSLDREPGRAYQLEARPMAELPYTADVQDLISETEIDSTGQYILPQHLILTALLRERDNPQLHLERFGVDYIRFREAILELIPNRPGQKSI